MRRADISKSIILKWIRPIFTFSKLNRVIWISSVISNRLLEFGSIVIRSYRLFIIEIILKLCIQRFPRIWIRVDFLNNLYLLILFDTQLLLLW